MNYSRSSQITSAVSVVTSPIHTDFRASHRCKLTAPFLKTYPECSCFCCKSSQMPLLWVPVKKILTFVHAQSGDREKWTFIKPSWPRGLETMNQCLPFLSWYHSEMHFLSPQKVLWYCISVIQKGSQFINTSFIDFSLPFLHSSSSLSLNHGITS